MTGFEAVGVLEGEVLREKALCNSYESLPFVRLFAINLSYENPSLVGGESNKYSLRRVPLCPASAGR